MIWWPWLLANFGSLNNIAQKHVWNIQENRAVRVPNMKKHSKVFQNTIKRLKMYTRRETNAGQSAQRGRDCLVSSASWLPLAFQVCSVGLSVLESRTCWSQEPARQSTALQVCSAPAPRATEDKYRKQQWWQLLLKATNETDIDGGTPWPLEPDHTYLLLLDARLFLYPRQYLGHVRFQHHPAHDQLGQDEMDLVHIRWLITAFLQ